MKITVAESQSRCAFRGGVCGPDTSLLTGAENTCVRAGGFFPAGGEGNCFNNEKTDSKCCITKPSKCAIEAGGVLITAPIRVRECALAMKWPAAKFNATYNEVTGEGESKVTKSCCVLAKVDAVVQACTDVGGACMPYVCAYFTRV